MRARTEQERAAYAQTVANKLGYLRAQIGHIEKEIAYWETEQAKNAGADVIAADFCDECGRPGDYRTCCYEGHP